MDNLWLLTEERPKLSVVLRILDEYNNDFGATVTVNENFNIRPIVKNSKFTFEYLVEGVSVQGIANVFIEIVSGNSSFVDYMLIRQEDYLCYFDAVEYAVYHTEREVANYEAFRKIMIG